MTQPTLSEIVTTLLNPLVSGRVWESATPDDLPRDNNDVIKPFILWSTMGGQDAEYVEQFPAPAFSNARLQIHCVSPSNILVERLMQAVRDALLASSYTVGVLGSPIGTYDDTRKLRGRRQQFSIWFRQTA